MVKTYEILKLLTEEEVEQMLAHPYHITPQLWLRDSSGCCPLGAALPGCAPSPTPGLIAHTLESRTPLDLDARLEMAFSFTNAADSGEIKPEDLAEIVRLSREV